LYWSVTINRTTFVHADFMIFKLEIWKSDTVQLGSSPD
jgi:hypothetical protein